MVVKSVKVDGNFKILNALLFHLFNLMILNHPKNHHNNNHNNNLLKIKSKYLMNL